MKVNPVSNTMSLRKNDNTTEENSKVMDFDRLFVEEIGQCGKFQMKIIVQCLIAVVLVSFNINEFVFTAARIETRCLIPECEGPSHTEFAPEWITNAIPVSGGLVDNCQRFGNSSSLPGGVSNETCPASLFDTNVVQRCDQYVYQKTNTIVYDFGLACDEWRRSIVGSVRILCWIGALLVTGLVSDRWGRRRALAINSICAALFGVLRYWASNYTVYMLLMVLESILGLGSFSTAYVLTVEWLGPKYRVMGGAMINTTFAVGEILLAMIAWIVPNWRNLILALYIPQFLTIIFFWTLTESVRWLQSKGKFQEAEDLIKKASRVNRKKLSQISLEELENNTKQELKREKEDEIWLIVLVFRHKQLMVRCVVTCTWWMATILVYYGLTINAVALLGNMYLSYALVALVELPGYVTVVMLVDRIGRKFTIITAFWLCALCQLGFIFISNVTFSLVVYLVGKWSISVVITTVNIYTLELYPTECRHRLYSVASMAGRFGSILAPLTPALGATFFPELPFVIFGSMALLAGLVSFFVPETLGSKLPDTIHEAFPNTDNNTNNNN